MKKIITKLLATALLVSCIPTVPVSAETETQTNSKVLYNNTFDKGSNADLPAVSSADFYYPGYNAAFKTALNNYEYASANAPLNYSVAMNSLSKATENENTGVKLSSTVGVQNGPVVLFDFRYQDENKTPTATPDGLKSGKYTLSFDFSVQGGTADADGETRILANCFHGNTASNLAHFGNTSWSIMSGSNSWTYHTKNMALDDTAVYSYKMVLDFDNHKVEHYIDGELKGTLENYNTTVKFLMIVLNGDVDYLDNVKLEKEFTYPIEYTVTSAKTGNNFFGDEDMKLTVTATNRTDTEYSENLVIKATNPQGGNEQTIKEQQITVPANGTATVDLINPFGKTYGSWVVTAQSERSRLYTTRAARVVDVKALNEAMAICAHFDGRHAGLDIAKAFDLMEAAGISMVRSDQGYQVEKDAEGNIIGFDDSALSSSFTTMAQESKESGIKVLSILYEGNNAILGYDEDGGFNTTEEALAAYRKYCEDAARTFKEYGIEHFELGNEDNYKTKPATQSSTRIMAADKSAILNNGKAYKKPGVWYTAVDASTVALTITQTVNKGVTESYATLKSLDGNTTFYENVRCFEPESGVDYSKILKAGYDGIKAGNPNAVVLNSGSAVVYEDENTTIRNQYEFADQLLGEIAASGEKYYDVWAVHSYFTGAQPEAGDAWKRHFDFCDQQNLLTDLLEKHGQRSKNAETNEIEKNVPVWTTEVGYSSAPSEERMHASWMTRLLALNFMGDEYGPYHDKFFIYALFNHGFDKAATAENTFGIVNNWNNRYWYEDTAYSVKENYLTVAQWNNLMNGASFVNADIEETSAGYVDGDETFSVANYKFEFDRNGDKVALVWDLVGNKEMTVSDDEVGHIKVYDMYGNVLQEEFSDSITVTTSSEPLYVEFTEAEPEILLFRDYEDYTSGTSIYNNGTQYGTWNVSTSGGVSDTSKAVAGADGTGVEVNTSAKGSKDGSWGKDIELNNLANTGIFYVAFDIEKKSDEVLESQDGNTTTLHETMFYMTDSTGNSQYVRFSNSHSSVISGLDSWHTLAAVYLPSGVTRVETIVDLDNDKVYVYENGVKVQEGSYTSDIKKLCMKISNGIAYFDNFAIIHYPSKNVLPTYSIKECEYDAQSNTISVVLKSDLRVPNGEMFHTAPYGISLQDALSSFKVTGADGSPRTVSAVTRGQRAGEYILNLNQ